MTPLLLITGFLGSGKTTLLRRIAERARDRRLIFLVNEFSSVDVDGALARATAGAPVLSIAGGSIFCRCKATDLIETLRALHSRAVLDRREGVVVEASGMADPRALTPLLAEARLDGDFRVARIVAVVDPGRYLKVRQTLVAADAQIAAADLVLLNKSDLYPPETQALAEAAVRTVNPPADVRRAVRGDVEFDWFPDAPVSSATAPLAPCRDPNFETFTLDAGPSPDFEEWRRRLATVREDVYRVKGIVGSPDGRLRLWEDAGHGLNEADAPAGVEPTRLVVICRGGGSGRVRAALQQA